MEPLLDHTKSVCDTCMSSSYCSQLRLALHVLGEALANATNANVYMRYREILDELNLAGWQYPESRHICLLAENRSQIKGLTDELIALAKIKSSDTLSSTPNSPSDSSPLEQIPSLLQEETSCE